MSSGLEDFSLFDLFRMEAEEQVRVLQSGLIDLEAGKTSAETLEALMRAAHSIKGAARIVGLDVIVNMTHVVEDRFVAAQCGQALDSVEIDRMLTATDWLARLQAVPEAETAEWLAANNAAIEAFTATFAEAHMPATADSSAPFSAPQSLAMSGPTATPSQEESEEAGKRHLRRARRGSTAPGPRASRPHRRIALRPDPHSRLRDPGRVAQSG